MNERKNLIPFNHVNSFIHELARYIYKPITQCIIDLIGVFSEIKIGAEFDVMDKMLQNQKTLYRIHFRTWFPSLYDEWLDLNKDIIQPLGTKTLRGWNKSTFANKPSLDNENVRNELVERIETLFHFEQDDVRDFMEKEFWVSFSDSEINLVMSSQYKKKGTYI